MRGRDIKLRTLAIYCPRRPPPTRMPLRIPALARGLSDNLYTLEPKLEPLIKKRESCQIF